MSRLGVVLVAALVLAGTAAFLGSGLARADTVSVDSGNVYFCSPAFENGVCDTSVTAGDTVTWTNVAGFHTITECTEDFATCPPPGGFDSGVLEAGQTFSQTFATAGTYPYNCVLHPSQMQGRILVSAAETPSPSPAPVDSGAPTATGSPTPAGQPAATITPGSVPSTGGPSETGGGAVGLFVLAGGIMLMMAAASLVLGRFGRERL